MADASPEIGWLLCQATNHWQRRLRAALRPLGLSQAQFMLLEAAARLDAAGMATTQVAVARAARLDITVVSQVSRQLAEAGLLLREKGLDERSRLVRPTPAGLALLARTAPHTAELDRDFFALLGENRDAFAGALAALGGEKIRVRVKLAG